MPIYHKANSPISICACVCVCVCKFVLVHGLLSCVSAVFVVCSSGLGGGGGGGLITSSLHTSHGTAYEFLGIYRLWPL